MSLIEVDFENVSKPIAPGHYLAEVFAATTKPAKKDGSTNLVFTWVIIEDGEFKGRKIDQYQSLSDQKDEETRRKSAYFLKSFLDEIGAPYEGKRFDLSATVGCKAVLEIVADEYQGKPTAKISKVMKANL